MVKNLFRKIKFMFTGRDKLKETCVRKEEDHRERLVVKEPERPIKDYRIKIKLAYNDTKFCVLNGRYGKDKEPLIRILIRTRKPRIKKKLIKRIVN